MSFLTRATCPTCGRGVVIHRDIALDPVAGLHPTKAAHSSSIEDRFVYLIHQCRDADIETFQARCEEVVAQLEQLHESQRSPWDGADYVDARAAAERSAEDLRRLVARHALDRICPKCGVQVGAHCENLTQRRRGEHVPTKAPHQERTPLPESIAGQEIADRREQLGTERALVNQIYTALAGDEAIEKLLHIVQGL